MFKKLLLLTLALIWVAGLISPAPATHAQGPSAPVVLELEPRTFLPYLADPFVATNAHEVDTLANLYVGLLDIDRTDSTRIIPYLADSWDIINDGLTYRFYLRDDVYWVRYDAATDTIERLRPVDAHDVVYAVHTVCSTYDNGYYATDVVGPWLVGCALAQDGADPNRVMEVTAIDDYTVEMNLTTKGLLFQSIATLWTLYPIAREQYEEGAGLMTSGPFVYNLGTNTFIRNPYFPSDLWGGGNVDRVVMRSATPKDWETGRVARLRAVPDGLDPALVYSMPTFVQYLGFSVDRPPLDNVHVRRALATSLPRDPFLASNAYGDAAEPLYHFAPYQLFGGLPSTAAGVGFDLDYARAELEAAGYPNCEGLPTLYIQSNTVDLSYFRDAWAALGCSAEQIAVGGAAPQIGDNTARRLLPEERAHVFEANGWAPDYNDVDNYMDLIECGPNNTLNRPCTELDTKIERARTSTDPAERLILYRELQDDLFGPAGEFPLVPLVLPIEHWAVQPWFLGPHGTNGLVHGERYDYYSVDVDLREQMAESIPTAAAPTTSDGTTGTATPSAPATTTPSVPTPNPNAPALPPFDLDAPTCRLLTLYRVVIRSAASVDGVAVGYVDYAQVLNGVARAVDEAGRVWWQLDTGGWVYELVVRETNACFDLP